MKLKTIAVLGSIAGLPALALAADKEATKSDLEGVNFGSQIFGPKVDLESLKGRVVLVEFWGRN